MAEGKTKSENRDRVRNRVAEARKEAVDTIVSMMEDKGLEWSCGWEAAAFMPHNGVSERRYSGGNRVHLMAKAVREGYGDARWFTAKQAKELGYHPIKGVHGAIVEYWKRKSMLVDAKGNPVSDPALAEETVSYMQLVSYFTVFNAEQLIGFDGKPMEPEAEVDRLAPNEELEEVADALIASSRCPVHESKTVAQACYKPLFDGIEMPSRLGFSTMESFIATLTHEMSHSTMKPLNREQAALGRFGSPTYAFEELVAELGSTFTCMELGIHRPAEFEGDENFENHAAYLQSWIRALKDDPDCLFTAAGHADKAADYLIERYGEQIERESRVRGIQLGRDMAISEVPSPAADLEAACGLARREPAPAKRMPAKAL